MDETIADLRQYDGERLALLGGELPANSNPPTLAASVFVKSGAGRLFGFTVTNTNAATRYIQVFDAGAPIPADGAVPFASWQLGTGRKRGRDDCFTAGPSRNMARHGDRPDFHCCCVT